jgi:hypothetical protein
MVEWVHTHPVLVLAEREVVVALAVKTDSLGKIVNTVILKVVVLVVLLVHEAATVVAVEAQEELLGLTMVEEAQVVFVLSGQEIQDNFQAVTLVTQ